MVVTTEIRAERICACIALTWINVAVIDAQCSNGLCPAEGWRSSPAASTPLTPVRRSASLAPSTVASLCRVANQKADGAAIGSGSLVHVDGAEAYVLTCSHLFDGGVGSLIVTFPDARRFAAALIERDATHDLALLKIANPSLSPIAMTQGSKPGRLTVAGYGANAHLRVARGPVIGEATPVGARHASLKVGVAARQGDSGGPALDDQGRLVGVVWGVRDQVSFITWGAPLRALLAKVASRANPRPSIPTHPSSPLGSGTLQEFDRRIARLESKPSCQCKGDWATREEVAEVASRTTSRAADARRKAIATVEAKLRNFVPLTSLQIALGGLSLGGPVGTAILLSRLLSRRRRLRTRRGLGGPRSPTFQENRS